MPSDQQNPEKVKMTWEIIEFTPSKMKIQLHFETALFISFEAPDILVIEFADPDIFISEHGIQILPENRIIRRKLMK